MDAFLALFALSMILALFRGGVSTALPILLLACQIFFSGLGLELGLSDFAVIGFCVLSVPLAAMLTSSLLSKFCLSRLENQHNLLLELASLVALVLLLNPENYSYHLERMVQGLVNSQGTFPSFSFAMWLAGRIAFLTSVLSVSMMLLSLCLEIPARILQHAAPQRVWLPLPALRSILVIAAIGFAFSFIVELFSAELSLKNYQSGHVAVNKPTNPNAKSSEE